MLRFGFVTCVQLGLSCMQAIYDAGGRLSFAATLHDGRATHKSGRIYLDDFCSSHGIPLTKLANINDADAVAAIRAASLDWLLIIGWSQIARPEVLGATRHGALGIHPTLLPVGRGRAAIPWAILLGLQETGVTLFQLDEGVDTGPILAQQRVPIVPRETATTLYEKVRQAHRDLILRNWGAMESDALVPRSQTEELATSWAGRRPEDGRLDPAMRVVEADRLVRAVTHPYPGAYIDVQGRRLRVWEAHEVTGVELGPAGGPTLPFQDGWLYVTQWNWESD